MALYLPADVVQGTEEIAKVTALSDSDLRETVTPYALQTGTLSSSASVHVLLAELLTQYAGTRVADVLKKRYTPHQRMDFAKALALQKAITANKLRRAERATSLHLSDYLALSMQYAAYQNTRTVLVNDADFRAYFREHPSAFPFQSVSLDDVVQAITMSEHGGDDTTDSIMRAVGNAIMPEQGIAIEDGVYVYPMTDEIRHALSPWLDAPAPAIWVHEKPVLVISTEHGVYVWGDPDEFGTSLDDGLFVVPEPTGIVVNGKRVDAEPLLYSATDEEFIAQYPAYELIAYPDDCMAF